MWNNLVDKLIVQKNFLFYFIMNIQTSVKLAYAVLWNSEILMHGGKQERFQYKVIYTCKLVMSRLDCTP